MSRRVFEFENVLRDAFVGWRHSDIYRDEANRCVVVVASMRIEKIEAAMSIESALDLIPELRAERVLGEALRNLLVERSPRRGASGFPWRGRK